jgi:hypothetical protein
MDQIKLFETLVSKQHEVCLVNMMFSFDGESIKVDWIEPIYGFFDEEQMRLDIPEISKEDLVTICPDGIGVYISNVMFKINKDWDDFRTWYWYEFLMCNSTYECTPEDLNSELDFGSDCGLDFLFPRKYYIQNGFVGNSVLWWAEKSNGYTTDIRKAGRYTKEQAENITKRPQDIAWPCSYIDSHTEALKHVIDGQYLDREKSIIGNLK